MKNEKHLPKSIYKTVPALLILFTFYAAAPETAFAVSPQAPKIEANAPGDDFDRAFREGRDLIDKEQWARAAEKFGEAVEKHPTGKSVDAALYWLAFCHKKQKQFKEADRALDRLLERFPASSWAADARVMKMEIAAPLGRLSPAGVAANAPLGVSRNPPATISPCGNAAGGTPAARAANLPCLYESSVTGANAARTPLDREDEIKIAAFQSLLAADPRRAIETLGEILKTDSDASETLKIEVLRALRSPRLQRTDALIFAVGNNGGAVGKEFLPLLRETLVNSFQNESNVKIRKEIIYALASLADDQSTDHLKKLYAAENDREMKRAIINSFSPPSSSFYSYQTNAAPKRKIESDVLWEIVRTEKDSELRLSALANLQRFPNWAAGKQTLETLSRLYDSETDEPFKISIIRAIVAANQTGTGRKLLDIAKNDRSDKLRLEAIYSLRNSRNPEVLKFLEELIK